MKLHAILFVLTASITTSIAGCTQQAMKPIASVEEGVRLVDSIKGEASEFDLPVPDSLLDPFGVKMAIITDRALARGWQPDGFTQEDGYRIFHYKKSK